MKTKLLLSLGIAGLMASGAFAQVGINNSATNPDASAILDLNTGNAGVNKGFLPPQVALTNVATAAPVTSPATGLIVFSTVAPAGGNGIGYYYWTGTAWAPFAAAAGTLSGSGTNNYLARWTPNGNTLGTSLIQDNGTGVGINIAPYNGYEVYAYANTGTAIDAYTSDATGFGVGGYNSASTGVGVYGAGKTYGVEGDGTFYGNGSGGYFYDGTDFATIADVSNGYGVNAYGGSAGGYFADANGDYTYLADNSGYGIYAYGSAADNIGGFFGSSTGAECWIGDGTINVGGNFWDNTNATNGQVASGLNSSGLYGTSTLAQPGYGVWGKNLNSNAGTGVGIYGEGSGATGYTDTYGAGVFGEGTVDGIDGYADNNTGSVYPGYFWSGYGNWASIAEHVGGTDYKVNGSGTVATTIKDENNQYRIMNCPEAPEILFEDYGTGSLVNGKVHVNLDPTWAKNVAINEKHPLRVLITLEGECNGIFVTNKSTTGFDVVELQHGNSNVAFTYEVIANRADSYDDNGKLLSKNADNRFVAGSGPRKMEKSPVIAAPAQQPGAAMQNKLNRKPVLNKPILPPAQQKNHSNGNNN